MTITCKKLFETLEEAKSCALAHRTEKAKLTRSTEEMRNLMNSARNWMVTWYQHTDSGEESKPYWRNQRTPDGCTLASAAARF